MTDWNAFADRAYLKATDILLVYDDVGTGINVPANALVKYDASGNVGIGTAAIYKVDILGGTNSIMRHRSSAGLARFILESAGTGAKAWSISSYNGSFSPGQGFAVTDETQNLVRLTIDHGGNVAPGQDNVPALGLPAARWSQVFAATGTINTSDARAKSDIELIPDAWLDAWGEVEWSRFKFKGGSRWHVGLIAQHVHAAFAERNIDAFEIGLCCFDEWGSIAPIKATAEKKGPDGVVIEFASQAQPGRAAGDRWGLRYDECQAIEAAWQRREITRLTARLAAIEAAAAA